MSIANKALSIGAKALLNWMLTSNKPIDVCIMIGPQLGKVIVDESGLDHYSKAALQRLFHIGAVKVATILVQGVRYDRYSLSDSGKQYAELEGNT